MQLIETHLSRCSVRMDGGGALGDIRGALEGHIRFLLNRWRDSPQASRAWTRTMTGGAPVGSVPSLGSTTGGSAREKACCMPGHRATALTATPGGMGRVCACPSTGHSCLRNQPTVMPGTNPPVKMSKQPQFDSWFLRNTHRGFLRQLTSSYTLGSSLGSITHN